MSNLFATSFTIFLLKFLHNNNWLTIARQGITSFSINESTSKEVRTVDIHSRNGMSCDFLWNCFEKVVTRTSIIFICSEHMTEKWIHFDLKSWVTGGTKIWPGIPNNWRIFESNWFVIESQFDSIILKVLGIPGQILVPPVTQLFRSKWLHFFSDMRVVVVSLRENGSYNVYKATVQKKFSPPLSNI